MDLFQILAIIAGGMIIISTIPQIFKTLKTEKVEDLSLVMFILIVAAQVIWLFYGLHIQDIPVILTNGFGMLVTATNIILILKYRKTPTKKYIDS